MNPFGRENNTSKASLFSDLSNQSFSHLSNPGLKNSMVTRVYDGRENFQSTYASNRYDSKQGGFYKSQVDFSQSATRKVPVELSSFETRARASRSDYQSKENYPKLNESIVRQEGKSTATDNQFAPQAQNAGNTDLSRKEASSRQKSLRESRMGSLSKQIKNTLKSSALRNSFVADEGSPALRGSNLKTSNLRKESSLAQDKLRFSASVKTDKVEFASTVTNSIKSRQAETSRPRHFRVKSQIEKANLRDSISSTSALRNPNLQMSSVHYGSGKKESDTSVLKSSSSIASGRLPLYKSSVLQETKSSLVKKKNQLEVLPLHQRGKKPEGLCLQDFKLGSLKGEGRFGKFYPAVHKQTGMLVGIKEVKKESLRFMLDQFIQELKIQTFANHANIVKLYGMFSTEENFYLVMEYMEEGSLFSFVKKHKKVDEQETSAKLKQVCSAVEYLHENDILHRDIKPENIVLTCDVCKLCDFGWAVYSNDRRKTYCGTLDYVCPEILEGEEYDSCVDIWAIGVLAYEMIVGKAPFYNISRKETMKRITGCDLQLPPEMSQKAKDFVQNSLKRDPSDRCTIQMLVKHAFLK